MEVGRIKNTHHLPKHDLCTFNVKLGVSFVRLTEIISLLYCLPQIEHLYGLTVFENYLYATNSDEGNLNPKTSVIRVNRFNSSDFQVVTRVDRGTALHVYHQRRQPQGTACIIQLVCRLDSSVFWVAEACVPVSPVSAQPRVRPGSVRKGRRLL